MNGWACSWRQVIFEPCFPRKRWAQAFYFYRMDLKDINNSREICQQLNKGLGNQTPHGGLIVFYRDYHDPTLFNMNSWSSSVTLISWSDIAKTVVKNLFECCVTNNSCLSLSQLWKLFYISCVSRVGCPEKMQWFLGIAPFVYPCICSRSILDLSSCNKNGVELILIKPLGFHSTQPQQIGWHRCRWIYLKNTPALQFNWIEIESLHDSFH